MGILQRPAMAVVAVGVATALIRLQAGRLAQPARLGLLRRSSTQRMAVAAVAAVGAVLAVLILVAPVAQADFTAAALAVAVVEVRPVAVALAEMR